MKPLIAVVSECHSDNLGDQAIAHSLSEIVLPNYRVSMISFSRIAPPSIGYLGTTNAPVRKLRMVPFIRAIPPRIKARVRWCLLFEKAKFARHYGAAIDQSDLVIIGGGQLIKNNVALFCEKLALVSKQAASRSIPVGIVGVGVDSKMEKKNWQVIKNPIDSANIIILRDGLSRDRVTAAFSEVDDPVVLPDLAFALNNPDVSRPLEDRGIALAVNVMDLKSMGQSGNISGECDNEKLVGFICDVVVAAKNSTVDIVTLFTSGAANDLAAARKVRDQVHSQTGFELPVFHPQTLDDFLAFLANVREVIGTRMHAGILAYISGCNTLCINWNDKVQGVWSAVGQQDRVIQVEEILHPDAGEKIITKLNRLSPASIDCLCELAEEVRLGVLNQIDKVLINSEVNRF